MNRQVTPLSAENGRRGLAITNLIGSGRNDWISMTPKNQVLTRQAPQRYDSVSIIRMERQASGPLVDTIIIQSRQIALKDQVLEVCV